MERELFIVQVALRQECLMSIWLFTLEGIAKELKTSGLPIEKKPAVAHE